MLILYKDKMHLYKRIFKENEKRKCQFTLQCVLPATIHLSKAGPSLLLTSSVFYAPCRALPRVPNPHHAHVYNMWIGVESESGGGTPNLTVCLCHQCGRITSDKHSVSAVNCHRGRVPNAPASKNDLVNVVTIIR